MKILFILLLFINLKAGGPDEHPKATPSKPTDSQMMTFEAVEKTEDLHPREEGWEKLTKETREALPESTKAFKAEYEAHAKAIKYLKAKSKFLTQTEELIAPIFKILDQTSDEKKHLSLILSLIGQFYAKLSRIQL